MPVEIPRTQSDREATRWLSDCTDIAAVSDSLIEIVDALRVYADWQARGRRSPDFTSRRFRESLVEDRRAHPRVRPIQLDRPMLARLKRGPLLTLLDVSAGGALIETSERLNPGAHVLLEFLVPGTRHTTLMHSRVTRSHVAALDEHVRYRGGCSFDDVLDLPYRAAAPDPLQAVRQLLAEARGLDKLGIGRLLNDMQRMTEASASRTALIAHVESWLRSQVPLLALRITPASRGHNPVNIEFLPACELDDSQARLLQAGASVMSVLYAMPR